MMKLFLLNTGYIPSPAKGHPISKWEVPTVAMAFGKFPALQKQTLPLRSLALDLGILIPWEWLPHSGAAPFLPLSE